MWLKHRDDIVWDDLEKLESPFFARHWVTANVNVNDDYQPHVRGLSSITEGSLGPASGAWDQHSYDRLLQRIEEGEVLLVHDAGSHPVLPLLKRQENDDQESWQINNPQNHGQEFNLSWMLTSATRTKRPKASPKKPEVEQQNDQPFSTLADIQPLTVTNPRWQHTDNDRAKESPTKTIAKDKVKLKVDVTGASDGSPVTFTIVDASKSPPMQIESLQGQVEGGIGVGEWQIKKPHSDVKLEFSGEIRQVNSGRAEIPLEELVFIFSF